MWVQEILPSHCLTDGPSVCVCVCLSSSAKAQPLSRLRRMCLCLLSIEGGQVIYLPNEERYKKKTTEGPIQRWRAVWERNKEKGFVNEEDKKEYLALAEKQFSV